MPKIIHELTTEQKDIILKMYNEGKDILDISREFQKNYGKIIEFLNKNGAQIKTRYHMNEEEARQMFKSKGYEMLSGYQLSSIKVELRCPVGHIHITTSNLFRQGGRCGECNKERSVPKEEVLKLIELEGYKLLGPFVNYTGKIKAICPKNHETKVSFSRFLSGDRCRKCFYLRNRRDNHYAWKIDRKAYVRRDREALTQWRLHVFIRDKFQCYKCFNTSHRKSGGLVAHHLNGFQWDEENRSNMDNAVTLCKKCHKEFHSIYGNKRNTIFQYNHWNPERKVINELLEKSCFDKKIE